MNSGNTCNLFEEEQWLKLVFVLNDAQTWINDQQRQLLQLVPIDGKKKMVRKSFYVSAVAIAHIIERHYFKTQRHLFTAKFTIPVIDILTCIRDASDQPAKPVKGTQNMQRILDAGYIVGYDQSCTNTSLVTVISDSGGRVVTAFPGTIEHTSAK